MLPERAGALTLHPLTRPDFPLLLAWRQAPHVREFWDNDDDPADITAAFIEADYAELLDPDHPTRARIFHVDGVPAGYLQYYPWSAYPDGAREASIPLTPGAWGLDIFVGDAAFLGRGVGSLAVDRACRTMFDEHGATSVALLTDVNNLRAQRSYERAGFARVARALDTDRRGGVRIASWLMVRSALD